MTTLFPNAIPSVLSNVSVLILCTLYPNESYSEKVINNIVSNISKIQTLYVAYEIPVNPELQRAAAPGSFLHNVVAVDAPSNFMVDIAHGARSFDWREDRARARSFVIDGLYKVDWPYDLAFEQRPITADNPLPERIHEDPFLMATGWWPIGCSWSSFRYKNDVPVSLAEVCRDERYRLTPNAERIGDRNYHILERPGIDRLWLDAERGGLLTRRQILDPDTGAVIREISLSDYREAIPSIWLPWNIDIVTYDAMAATSDGRRRVVFQTEITVRELFVNIDISNVFKFDPSAGAIWIIRSDQAWNQVKPGGLNYLGLQVQRIRPHLKPYRNPLLTYWLAIASFVAFVIFWNERFNKTRKST